MDNPWAYDRLSAREVRRRLGRLSPPSVGSVLPPVGVRLSCTVGPPLLSQRIAGVGGRNPHIPSQKCYEGGSSVEGEEKHTEGSFLTLPHVKSIHPPAESSEVASR